ncbi:MAG: hypothetical protein ACE5H7_08245 [Acidiferrobacterales bacterium]
MSIKSDLQAFSRGDIDKAPDEPGVYALYQGDRLIYIGRAEGGLSTTTIRARLKDHCKGHHGPYTEQATHYRCEVTPNPVVRQHELLQEYEQLHGRPPKCNPVSYVPRMGHRARTFQFKRVGSQRREAAPWRR